MRANRCCKVASRDFGHETTKNRIRVSDRQRPALVRRLLENAGWMVPGAILALLPKCPVCLAAYVAIGTGVGLSIPTASFLRMLLMTVCVASLLFVAARGLHRLIFAKALHIHEGESHGSDTHRDRN
jgi:hypothetical protein